MDLQALSRVAAEAVEQIDARIKAKLVKRALKQDIPNEGEAIAMVEARKRAAKATKRLRISHQGRHKGHWPLVSPAQQNTRCRVTVRVTRLPLRARPSLFCTPR